ncbi:MAG: TonB-dependent receptor domain-containing protein [Bryobacteraceae bacterium]
MHSVISFRTRFLFICLLAGIIAPQAVPATIFGTVRGMVHDPTHRPVAGAQVTLSAANSSYSRTASSGAMGEFEFQAVPVGEYTVRAVQSGFEDVLQEVTVTSGHSGYLHLQLQLAGQRQSVEVTETPGPAVETATSPLTLVSRQDIDSTPGADLSNSLAMITNFVPGSYMTHDQLHIRGGHQVTWEIDGVPIPNTNIASNVGPQVDPKDIDYLEVQRGGYAADTGDRTYGVLNVVPRTGFERDREIELSTTFGSFDQTNDQVSIGDHTEKLAWYASLDGNRSDYGLETPGPLVNHDRVWGLGGFASLIYNATPADQLRAVVSSRGDDYQIPNTEAQLEAGMRDVERERDVAATFTWAHQLSGGALLTVSPFMHFNRADYDGDPNDTPVATLQHLDSTYAGAQIAWNLVTAQHNAAAGVYGFAQHDDDLVGITDTTVPVSVKNAWSAEGGLAAVFLEDQWKPRPWLTLTLGLRLTHFNGAVAENAANPRTGAAIRIPRLGWIVRGFFGTYYQAPPLSTVEGPVLDYAATQGFGVIPLPGERDQENQAGLAIPLHGWTLDFNSFRQRAVNFFDHNAIGNSNVFFPLSIAGARIWGNEFTLRSPRLRRRAQASIAYSYQHAEGQGAITGGLTDFSSPASGWFLLDHDQRQTLHGNLSASLPARAWLSLSAYYGSGFTDGSSPVAAHLQPHTTFDVSLGKALTERLSLSLNALNVANRRYLLDNSQTFGGTHYADPRQLYVQLRYRFRY